MVTLIGCMFAVVSHRKGHALPAAAAASCGTAHRTATSQNNGRDSPSDGKLPRYSEMHPATVKALPGVVMVLPIPSG